MPTTMKITAAAAVFLYLSLIASATPAPEWQSRVTKSVLVIYDARARTSAQKSSAQAVAPAFATAAPIAPRRLLGHFDAKGRVQVDVEFDCSAAPPLTALKSAGLIIGTTVAVAPLCVVEGFAAPAAVPSLASVAGVKKIDLPHYAKHREPNSSFSHPKLQSSAIPQTSGGTPAIDGNGVTIMNADKYIAQTGISGGGITVAVINTGADSLSVIQGRGELPSVNVVQPSANPTPPANEDEGTMMLEEVHAVAPSAGLAFCGPQTYVEYVACVQALINAHVTVITDDLVFPGYDLMSSPSANNNTLAISNLLAANPKVMLFSAAGNNALNYWQGTYNPVAAGATTFTCHGQTDHFFQGFTSTTADIAWTSGSSSASDLFLVWTNTNGVSSANYDLYVLDGSLNVVACAPGSGSTEISGASTYDIIDGSALTSPNNYFIVIGTPDTSLSGKFLKLVGFGDGADTWSSVTPGSISSPQDFSPGVFPIGAVDGGDGVGNSIETYSATGPTQFELPTPSTQQGPIVVAPDDIYVDNVGTSFPTNEFSGTSAASPNSAAVAALILSAFPSLTSAQAIGAMQAGAAPLGSSSPNGTFGSGRVDAMGALGTLAAPTIAGFQTASIVGGGQSSALPVTVTGTGALTVTVVPAALIPNSSSGVTVSPSTCGNPTTACTVILTPTLGLSGATTIQLTVTDGANRTMAYQATVTVTKPPAPTISITSGGSQSVNVSAAIAPVLFTLTGTGPLTVTSTLSAIGSSSITSGCGKTTESCTATLGAAAATAGTGTLTVSVKDPYGQSASATASVTETVPSKSGGGSIDLGTLFSLFALALMAARKRLSRTPFVAPRAPN